MKTRDMFVSVDAKCPFYKRNSNSIIVCEGVEYDSTIHLSFATEKSGTDYKMFYCDARYERCPVYRMLLGKYEEDD